MLGKKICEEGKKYYGKKNKDEDRKGIKTRANKKGRTSHFNHLPFLSESKKVFFTSSVT